MAHPNEELAREAFRAITSGDIPWIEAHTSPDVVFHQGGRFPTAGTFDGRDAMFGHYMAFMELVEGKFSMELHDVLANDDHIVMLVAVKIGKGDRELVFNEAPSGMCATGSSPNSGPCPSIPMRSTSSSRARTLESGATVSPQGWAPSAAIPPSARSGRASCGPGPRTLRR